MIRKLLYCFFIFLIIFTPVGGAGAATIGALITGDNLERAALSGATGSVLTASIMDMLNAGVIEDATQRHLTRPNSTTPEARQRFLDDIEASGREGKQKKLRELATDDKLGSADRGWLKQEINSVSKKSLRQSIGGDLKPQKNIRVPPGKELAHKRGKPAKDGYGYEHSDLQSSDLHKLQHKHEGYK